MKKKKNVILEQIQGCERTLDILDKEIAHVMKSDMSDKKKNEQIEMIKRSKAIVESRKENLNEIYRNSLE